MQAKVIKSNGSFLVTQNYRFALAHLVIGFPYFGIFARLLLPIELLCKGFATPRYCSLTINIQGVPKKGGNKVLWLRP